MKPIAVFGAAFNPPHRGHMDVVAQLLPMFDSVIMIPSAAHASGKIMAPFAERMTMAKIILTECFSGEPRVTVSAIEQELLDEHEAEPPIYSFTLLQALAKRQQDCGGNQRLNLILGPDNAAPDMWHKFYRYREIEQMFGLHAVTERVPIRSSKIRALIRSLSHDDATLHQHLYPMVSVPLSNYIIQRKLYRNTQE